MAEAVITRLRPPGQPGYTDSDALNDIHALITTTTETGREPVGDIAAVLARTGRPPVRGRHIGTQVTESRIGWPVARVDAEDTAVVIRQDPAGPGLLIDITTTSPAERGQLTVTLDHRYLHHPTPTFDHPA